MKENEQVDLVLEDLYVKEKIHQEKGGVPPETTDLPGDSLEGHQATVPDEELVADRKMMSIIRSHLRRVILLKKDEENSP